ncbi:hypothetical protein C2857_001978 [Epichloe festucae Fl1]|uniref:Uncharacterized protein n=1 Tax=Epichloe festucae (strain Fl1) TaxID=877507 RepID=A0A7S9KRM1_EPIFF|nr:hypothetical protein C2857_001978 [Epichloe festucae Fl1]
MNNNTHPSMQSTNAPKHSDSSQPAYVPQFSATSAHILSRIRSTGSSSTSFTPNGSFPSRGNSPRKDKRFSSDTSTTVALPNNAATQSNCSATEVCQDRIAAISSRLKRKRSSRSDVPDFTQSTMSFPPAKASSTSAATPFLQPPALLKDPAVPEVQISMPGGSCSVPGTVDVTQEHRLSSMADGIVPARPELLGFYAGEASDLARTQYFMQKKRTDLLNILSFCDQLHPQLLVDIMVSVSKRHPDLPIFGSPDWEKTLHDSLGLQTESVKSDPRPMGRPRHGHTIVNPKARQRQKNAKRVLRRLILAQNEGNAPSIKKEERDGEEEGEDEEGAVEEDSLPPSWPEAGKGLYSKLPPETEDRRFLADDDDDEPFSQFMVDRFGKPVVVSACA